MNCANHPEVPASAYCQYCGKPLCRECVRSVGGMVYCETCLAARLGVAAGAAAGYPLPAMGPNPALAGLLGFIPGVGAMYNGQFAKGLAHVLIFAVLVSLSHSYGLFGILIAAWVFYQVFDAVQTAKARRDGLPLPDPLGLNDLGRRLGLQSQPPAPPPGAPFVEGTAVPPVGGTVAGAAGPAGYAGTAPGVGAGFAPPAAAYSEPYAGAPPPFAYDPSVPPAAFCRSNRPTGAILLIVLGILFLLGTLGVLSDDWVGRGWPLVIIGLGVWLLLRRSRETLPAPGGPMAGAPVARGPIPRGPVVGGSAPPGSGAGGAQ